MKTEDSSDGTVMAGPPNMSAGHGAGFVAGVLFGALLGAGLALLFAPDRGENTRGKLSRRMRSLRDDAREGIDRVGHHTREELRRKQRRIRAELARARARAEQALE